jgi:hypothetical protein
MRLRRDDRATKMDATARFPTPIRRTLGSVRAQWRAKHRNRTEHNKIGRVAAA